jgi:hypothetical protein
LTSAHSAFETGSWAVAARIDVRYGDDKATARFIIARGNVADGE